MSKKHYKGHELVAHEIAMRDDSICSAWEAIGFQMSFVEPVLRCLQESLGYRGWYLLPNDYLRDVVDDESYDFSSYELLQDIQEELGVDLTSCKTLGDEAATVGVLVTCVWQKKVQRENG